MEELVYHRTRDGLSLRLMSAYLLFGVLSAVFLFLVLVAAFSFLGALIPTFSQVFLVCFSYVSFFLSSFLSGFVAVCFLKRKGFVLGALSGCLFCFVTVFVGFCVYGCGLSFVLFFKFVLSALAGAFGGVISANK